jgi:enoyl-CoA hydratase
VEGIRLSNESWGARITLDRPPVNALSTPLLNDLADILQTLIDARPNLVVLMAAGRCFSAGADLKEHYKTQSDAWTRLQTGQRVLDKLRVAPFPTIAAVHGVCLGGAMNIIANCDIRIASESASFGNPEIKRGRAGGTSNLRGLISEGTIRWLAFTGENLDAVQAERAGLVQKIYPDATWHEDVERLAQTISGYGHAGLYTVKEGLQRTRNASPSDGQWVEQQLTYRMLLEGSRVPWESNESKDGAKAESQAKRP